VENFIYVGDCFIDRISDEPEQAARGWNRKIDRVEAFYEPTCGWSLKTVLALQKGEAAWTEGQRDAAWTACMSGKGPAPGSWPRKRAKRQAA
jgi:hypothetical protein